jgi:DNA-binding CsgD family transcriptional regulator
MGSLKAPTRTEGSPIRSPTCRELVEFHAPPPDSRILSATAWAEIARSLKLSNRETQIARGVFDNLTEGAIAAELEVSEHTVHSHFNRLFKKLRVTTRVQVVLRIMEQLLSLTMSQASCLPPVCRNRAGGDDPMQESS